MHKSAILSVAYVTLMLAVGVAVDAGNTTNIISIARSVLWQCHRKGEPLNSVTTIY